MSHSFGSSTDQTSSPATPAPGAVSTPTRSKPCHCSPQAHVNISTHSKPQLEPGLQTPPHAHMTRRGLCNSQNFRDKPHCFQLRTFSPLNPLGPAETAAHLLPLAPAGSRDSLACRPGPFEECSVTPPLRSRPEHKASQPQPGITPELPLHAGKPLLSSQRLSLSHSDWAQKYWYHTGTRDVLGERNLSKGNEFTQLLGITEKRKRRRGRERGGRDII